ncbi:MAG: hypothetical protein NTX20_09135 [Verrucomicrobia bacterium]|nr:hypothetical protein [Verrucomicrobiota bacterium]
MRDEFLDKLRRRIDAVGPCCSCLVIIVLALLGMLALLQRCR